VKDGWMVRPSEGGITSRAHMKGSYDTIEFQIIESRVMSSKLPPLVRTSVILIFCPPERPNNSSFAVFFAPFPERGIPDHLAHGSVTRVPYLRFQGMRLGCANRLALFFARWGPGKRRRDKAK